MTGRHGDVAPTGRRYHLSTLLALVALATTTIGLASPVRGAAATQATPVASPSASALPPSEISVSHGVASGDVTPNSALVWARATRGPAQMHVEYDTDPGFTNPQSVQTGPGSVITDTDFTAKIKLDQLTPDTRYYYRVWFTEGTPASGPPASGSTAGSFRTAPAPDTRRPISFTVVGDIAGQQFCRRPDQGYQLFERMETLTPDFVIGNGDMIYADTACPISGPAEGFTAWTNIPGDFPSIADPAVDWTNPTQVSEVYNRHWRYNRADPQFQRFLETTPIYAQWDDHEVINDFGATWQWWNKENRDRAGFPNLVNAGRNAFFSWNPIDRNTDEPNRVYRSFSWGADMDLFLLDDRSYRTRNDREGVTPGQETLFGNVQLQWLEQNLLNSKATWKVISSDVPLSIPTGSHADEFGRDAFANGTAPDFSSTTGFERQLNELLTFIDDNQIENVVFFTTDVHFAMSLSYDTDPNGDGNPLIFHEFISGPANAIMAEPADPDPTFNPTVLYSEGDLFNFQYARLEPAADGTTHLIVDVRGEDGLRRPGSLVDLAPR